MRTRDLSTNFALCVYVMACALLHTSCVMRPIDPAEDPPDLAVPSPGDHHVVRGGRFWDAAVRSRAAYRGPGFDFQYRGFRVLLPSAPSGIG